MANLLQSSQNKQTEAPGYYTSALCTIATQGKQAVENAKFIGATPLQQQAFTSAAANAGAAKPTLGQSGQVLSNAANTNISGAANPYLSAAMGSNPAQLAQCYMSPYIQNAVQGMSNIGMRNIQQNLAPQATAAAVGSGQFGSQRGAQVLGQVQANAMNDLNSQIANMENTGYANALQAATARQNLLNQMGSTAASAAQACASAKNVAGANLTNLGKTTADVNIACAENLAKLGAECQTIKQNEQCYALSKLDKYAGAVGRNQVPTNVKTTMCMSPLSAAGAIGAGTMGIINNFCKVSNALCKGYNAAKNIFNGSKTYDAASCGIFMPASGGLIASKNYDESVNYASGGAVGCASFRDLGALPCRR
jgi:hypothetical protein